VEKNFKLFRTVNQDEARIIIPLLEDNDIPLVKKHRDAGGIMEVYMEMNLYGIDLYIPEDKFEEAEQLISFLNEDK